MPDLRAIFRGCWLIGALFLFGCSPQAAPSPPPTPTPAALPTIAVVGDPATLPPTWTPTFTPSPAPPTVTRTPQPTLTPPPTLSAGEICESFTLLYEIPPRKVFYRDRVIPFAFTIEAPEVVVRFLAVHRRTGENQGIELAGGQSYLFEFPVSLLPVAGFYDWSLTIHSPTYGDLCVHEGTFTVLWLP